MLSVHSRMSTMMSAARCLPLSITAISGSLSALSLRSLRVLQRGARPAQLPAKAHFGRALHTHVASVADTKVSWPAHCLRHTTPIGAALSAIAAPEFQTAEIARLSPLLSCRLLQSAPASASATAEAADPAKKKKKVRNTPRAAAALSGLGQLGLTTCACAFELRLRLGLRLKPAHPQVTARRRISHIAAQRNRTTVPADWIAG